MSGRRISNKYSSSHSRDTKTQPVKRTIHIVCEGKTELDYFKAIKEKNGFRDYVEIELVDRLNVDRNDTDRLSMIQMAKEYEILHTTGKIPVRLFISYITSNYAEDFKERSFENFGMEFGELCAKLRESVRDTYEKLYYINENYVIDGFVKDPLALSREIIKTCNWELKEDVNFYSPNQDSSFGPLSLKCTNLDSYVIFDRDYCKNFGRDHKDYCNWLIKCEEEGIKPIISSPCFELWLYMHLEGNTYGSPSFLPEYGEEIKKKIVRYENPSFSEKEINQFIADHKDKSLNRGQPTRFDRFYHNGIHHAISESKTKSTLFYTNPEDLMDNPGTMMGIFLESLLR